MTLLPISAAALAASLCATGLLALSAMARADTSPVPDAAASARIRLFGQNGISVKFYRNSACYKSGLFGSGGAEVVSGGAGDAFLSLLGASSNTRIGMPDSPATRNLSARSGVLSKAYFKEYSVAAGEPLTVLTSFRDVSGYYCKNIARSFVPEAGADYEASMDLSFAHGTCELSVRRIQTEGEQVVLLPLDNAVSADECR